MITERTTEKYKKCRKKTEETSEGWRSYLLSVFGNIVTLGIL